MTSFILLLSRMFISYYTIIYFFAKNFFLECLYFSEYDIRMFLFVFWLRNRPSIKYVRNQGNGEGSSKMFTDAYRGRGVSRFMCTYALTLSLFMFLSYRVLWQQITVSIRLFFTWVLCIYIILDKGCHILYVFGLNSTVCIHIVGVRTKDRVVEKLVLRYVSTKWMAPNKYCRIFLSIGTPKYTKVSPPARKMSLFSFIIITIILSYAIIRIYIIFLFFFLFII